MPNQRKKGKKFVAAWIPEKLHEDLTAIAKKEVKTVSEVVDELLTAYVMKETTDTSFIPNKVAKIVSYRKSRK